MSAQCVNGVAFGRALKKTWLFITECYAKLMRSAQRVKQLASWSSALVLICGIVGGVPSVGRANPNCPVIVSEKIELDPFNKFELDSFKKLTRLERIQILKAYQEFFLSYENDAPTPNDLFGDDEESETAELDSSTGNIPPIDPMTSLLGIFSNADAGQKSIDLSADPLKFDCYYAGWPSKIMTRKDRTYCASPMKANATTYLKDDAKKFCKGSSLLCNPALFGEGLCAPQNTQKLRDTSFRNCMAAFDAAKRDLGALADEILSNPAMGKLYNQTGASVSHVCSVTATSFQKGTDTCRSLLRRLEYVQVEIKKRIGHTVIAKADLKPDLKADKSGSPGDTEVLVSGSGATVSAGATNAGSSTSRVGGGSGASGGGAGQGVVVLSGSKDKTASSDPETLAKLVPVTAVPNLTSVSQDVPKPGKLPHLGSAPADISPPQSPQEVPPGNVRGPSGAIQVGSSIQCYHALSQAMDVNVQKDYSSNTLVLPADSNNDVSKTAIKFTTDSAGRDEKVEVCANAASVPTVDGFFYPDTSSFQNCNIDNTSPSAPRKVLSRFLQAYAKYMVDHIQDPNSITNEQWLDLYKAKNPADSSPTDRAIAEFKGSYRLQIYSPRSTYNALQVCSHVEGDQDFKDYISASLAIAEGKLKAMPGMIVPGSINPYKKPGDGECKSLNGS